VDQVSGGVAEPLFCPSRIEEVAGFARTTVRDFPQVASLPLPLPAAGALVCRYSPPVHQAPGQQGPQTRFLGQDAAEELRAAYLARSTSSAPCADSGAGTRFAVVMTDATDSRRSFTVDLGSCAAVRGPAGASGAAGPWMWELLGTGLHQSGFGRRLSQ
jgi:hypothetical protein